MPDNNLFPELQPNISQYNTPEYDPNFDYYKNLTNNTYRQAALEYNRSANQNLGAFAGLDKLDNDNLSIYSKPTYFSPKREDFDAFRNSDYFSKYGFIAGANNASTYRDIQSFGNKLSNAFEGAGKLAAFQFKDQIKGWGRLFDAITSWDWSKLYDQDDLEEVNRKMDEIFSENRIFTDERDQNSIFTMPNFMNIVQQSGFTIGALAEIATEELLTAGLASGFEGAKVANLLKSLGTWGKRAEKLSEATSSVNGLRKIYESGKFLPFGETISGIAAASAREGTSFKSIFTSGFGGFYRDIRELNAAFTEARAEASGTYVDLRDKLMNEDGLSEQRANEIAREAANTNFNINSAVIGISNKIQFDNVFRGVKGAKIGLDESSPIGMWKNTFFKRGLNLNTLKEGIRRRPIQYFKNNLTEALQENLQDASNTGVQKYYEARYKNPGTLSLGDALADGVGQQFNKQGALTFLSGFLTGAITSPITKGISSIYKRIGTTADERKKRNDEIKEQVSNLNGLFSSQHGPNAGLQLSIGEAMNDALKNDNFKEFQDIKDQSVREFVKVAIETGQFDRVFDRLGSYVNNLSKEEFEKAFNISYSDKRNANEYVASLRDKGYNIYQDHENFVFKFGANPFSPTSSKLQYDAYNNAKWQFLFMKDAHKRAGERANSLISELSTTLKAVPSTEFTPLFDENLMNMEIKRLKESISLLTGADKKSNERKLGLLELIKKEQKDYNYKVDRERKESEFNPVYYRSYIKRAIENYGLGETNENINDAIQKIQDIISLKRDEKVLLKNINWLIQPANYAKFLDEHEQETEKLYKQAVEPKEPSAPKPEKPELKPEIQQPSSNPVLEVKPVIEESTPSISEETKIKLDEFARRKAEAGRNISLLPKIVEDIFGKGTTQTVSSPEESQYLGERNAYWTRVYNAIEQLKNIIDNLQGRTEDELTPLEQFQINNAKYLKEDKNIDALLKELSSQLAVNALEQEPEVEIKPKEEKLEGSSEEEEEENTETEEKSLPVEPQTFTRIVNEPMNFKTTSNEVINYRDKSNPIADLEDYAHFKNQFLRNLASEGQMGEYSFVLTLDSNDLYSNISSENYKGPKFEGDNPFTYTGERRNYVVVVKNQQGETLYFDRDYNKTTPDKGVVIAMALPITTDFSAIEKALGDKKEIVVTPNFISPGVLEEGINGLQTISDFIKGTDLEEKAKTDIPIYVATKDTSLTEKGAIYFRIGFGLNDIRLNEKLATQLVYNGKNINPFDLVGIEMTLKEAQQVEPYLNSIIYTNKNKNKYFKPVPVGDKFVFEPQGLTLQQFANSFINTENVHLNSTLKNYSKNKTIFWVENGQIKSEKVDYLDFISQNLTTNKRKLRTAQGKIIVTPVNNFLDFTLNIPTEITEVKTETPKVVTETIKKTDINDLIERAKKAFEENEKDENFFSDNSLLRVIDPKLDYKKIESSEIQWFIDTFEDYPIVLNVVKDIINGNAWGRFTAAGTYLYEAAQSGTAYHEAWHNFTQLFLTKEEKEKLYNDNRIGNETFKQTEERLADKFMEFASSDGAILPEGIKSRNIFQKIWDFIKEFFGVRTLSVDKLFNDLYKGNLYNYDFSKSNTLFESLNASLKNQSGEEILSTQDRKKYLDYMDTLLGNYMAGKNFFINDIINSRGEKRLDTFKNIYKGILSAMSNEVNELIQSPDITTNAEKQETLEKLVTIRENINPVLQAWTSRLFKTSPSIDEIEDMNLAVELSTEPDNIDDVNEMDTEEQEEIINKTGEISQESVSATLSKETKLIIKMLSKVEIDPETGIALKRDGKTVLYRNTAGLFEPVNITKFANTIAEILADTYTYDEMYNKLLLPSSQKKLPEIALLLERLPHPDNIDETSRIMRSSFERDFNRSYVGVYDVSLNLSSGESEGELELRLFVNEETKRGLDFIRRKFSENFQKTKPSKYIGKLADGRNYLLPTFKELAEYFANVSENPTTKVRTLINILSHLGFRFSPNAQSSPELREYITDQRKLQDITTFLTEVGLRVDNDKKIITNPVKDLFENTQRQKLAPIIYQLLSIEDKYNPDTSSLSYQTAKGTQKYALMNPSLLFRVMNKIKNASNLKELAVNDLSYLDKEKNPNVKNSLILNSLFSTKGNRQYDLRKRKIDLIFGDYNGFKTNIDGKDIKKQTTDLSDREKLIMDFNSLLTVGTIDIMRTESSASSYFYKLNTYKHGKVYSDILPFSLYLLYNDEIEGRKLVYNYFRGIYEDEQEMMKKQGLSTSGIFSDIFTDGFSEKELDDFIMNDTFDFLKFMAKNGLTEENAKSFINKKLYDEAQNLDVNLYGLARAFVLNDLVLNIEYSKLVSGPIQYYKAYHKRAKTAISTGILQSTSDFIKGRLEASKDRTMRYALKGDYSININEYEVLTTKDDEVSINPSLKKLIKLALGDKFKSDKFEKYNNINAADGQGRITLDGYRELRMRVGTWGPYEEATYVREVNKWKQRKGLSISDKEKQILELYNNFPDVTFKPIKAQYDGPAVKEGHYPVAHKFSLAPLVPSAIVDTPLDNLNDHLLENGIYYQVHESGSKKWKGSISNWFNKTRSNLNLENGITTLYSGLLKEQIVTKSKRRDESTWGTQMRKLFFSNLFNSGKASKEIEDLKKEYLSTLKNIYNEEKDNLYREFGIKEEDGKITINDVKPFVDSILAQMEARDLNQKIKESISYDDVTGKFKYPLEINLNRQDIINLIGGMIDRRLRRLKVNGDIITLVSSSGFEKKGESLRFYEPIFKDNKFIGTKPMQVKMGFSNHYYNLLNLNYKDEQIKTLENLNKALKDENWVEENMNSLLHIGYRIPTQGPNSIEFFVPQEFLPETFYGVVPPKEYVVKTGGDFDDDKLHIFRPTIQENGMPLSENYLKTINKRRENLLSELNISNISNSLISNILTSDKEVEDEEDIELLPVQTQKILRELKSISRDIKGYYQNKALNTYYKVLSSPEMYDQLITPNSSDTVKSIAIEIGELLNKPGTEDIKNGQDYKGTQVFRAINNYNKFNQNLDGKADLGMWAVNNTFSQLLQQAGVQLNPEYIATKIIKGVKVPYKRTLMQHLLSKEEKEQFGNSLSNLYSSDNRFIQEIISELINATVDIASDPFYALLGINNENKGVVAYLLTQSVPFRRIIYFINQKPLRDFYDLRKKEPFIVGSDGNAYATNTIHLKALTTGVFSKRDVFERFVESVDKRNSGFTDEQLKEMINSDDPGHKAKVVAHFYKLREQAQLFRMLQMSNNYDTTKYSTPLSAFQNQLVGKEVNDSKLFKNAENIAKESLVSTFDNRNIVRDIFASLFPYNYSNNLVNVFNDLSPQIFNKKDKERFERRVAADFIEFIVKSFAYSPDKTKNLAQYSSALIANSPNSLYNRMIEIKTKYPELSEKFELFKKMLPNFELRDPFRRNIEIVRSLENNTDYQDLLIDEYEKLLKFSPALIGKESMPALDVTEIRQFMYDLARVGFYQSGFNKSLFFFLDIVPNHIFDNNFTTALQKFVSLPQEEKDKLIAQFKKQFKLENTELYGFASKQSYRGKSYGLNVKYSSSITPEEGTEGVCE